MGNKEIFDQMAGRYETPERIEMAKAAAEAAKGYISDSEMKILMDFGCGTGVAGLELIDLFSSVLFVDASQNMVAFVKEKIAAKGIHNAEALCVDLETEESVIPKADYIVAVQVLLHIKDVKAILEQLNGLLNEGGHLIIIDFDKNDAVQSELVHSGFDREELIGLLEEAGFGNVQSRIFHHGEKIFMNQDASQFVMDAVKKV